MIYDPAGQRVILFGGEGAADSSAAESGVDLDDTWSYDPATERWIELHPAGEIPSARGLLSMVYDPAGERIILFGGGTAGMNFNDTWAYDPSTNTWTELEPTGAVPQERCLHAMVYDEADKKVILFGGFGETYLGDTWSYDPAANLWTELKPAGEVPAPRGFHSMVYDPSGGKVILFGGGDGNGHFGDTWIYDPAANLWTEMTPAGESPAPRSGQSMFFDPDSGQALLVGGGTELVGYNDTWAYDPAGNSWTRLDPTGELPPEGGLQVMAFDPAARVAILFGGRCLDAYLDDTWTLSL
jgi:N-acetylneuraminic acid mutarotase